MKILKKISDFIDSHEIEIYLFGLGFLFVLVIVKAILTVTK